MVSTIDDWMEESFGLNTSQSSRFTEDLGNFENHSLYGSNCPSAGPNLLARYISMILYVAVCVIGLFGNSLVI